MVVEQLVWSFLHRPYVAAFLLAFLVLSLGEQGRQRTVFWLCSSFLVAFAAEWSSINFGVPFGWYVYHYDALSRDLVIFGVPFFDSLSFSFLSYVSYSFAIFFLSAVDVGGCEVTRKRSPELRRSKAVWVLSAVLMVVIDLIVDPIALQGKYWFLGDIYHYPEAGTHFGVPLTNYFGWLAVALVTVKINQAYDKFLQSHNEDSEARSPSCALPMIGVWPPVLWGGIVLFQLAVTGWVASRADIPLHLQETLALQTLTGAFIVAPILVLALVHCFRAARLAPTSSPQGISIYDQKPAFWYGRIRPHCRRAKFRRERFSEGKPRRLKKTE